MQPPHDPIQQAHESYETHLKSCRQCAADGSPCPVAKHLRRVHNLLLRAERNRPHMRTR
ncbi:heterodisulfide reductase subunit C [Streptomyces sp. SAI-229]|jgi:hypothetical protein